MSINFFFVHVLSFLSSFWMGWSAPEATFCGFLPKWVLQCYKMIKLHISSMKMWQTFKHLYSQHDWLVSGRMDLKKKKKSLFNPHVLTTRCYVSVLPYKFELSLCQTRQVITQRSAGTLLEVIAQFVFSDLKSSDLVFLTWPETMATAVWCAGGRQAGRLPVWDRGWPPPTEEDPDQLIMKSQSPCRTGALAYRVALSHLLWLVLQKSVAVGDQSAASDYNSIRLGYTRLSLMTAVIIICYRETPRSRPPPLFC